uniref:protein-L-isoaspartate(D-aspartate) O-methyltransferase n=1 Tax=Chromera velia CCMP2878 TaxID=1169474 RepID=A0A0G4GE07_9ALVE|eukprot:Cvel_21475.t1-p1 / transcript=Cvel_21475.t1 / gene=Cvel_21475 / organism=Chromera_velia_CCMP2878 / gene_product=Protein-L-isoaspartate(D-aspartate), putative / transcript_product=Protein-L-isoaspartate(D-aspartate), putative / location=Cvel_scaffold2016:23242-25191(+) / protein_length=235 / sequence_SO=supercontig / SO=protein_coding / is_pseudo=false
MAWRSSGGSHAELVKNLASNGVLSKQRAIDAMMKVDRKHFCKLNPYFDSPQTIGWGQTISAPHMHAFAAEALESRLLPGKRALDVGSGTGYVSAMFAEMVDVEGEGGGTVVGVECVKNLVDLSRENIRSHKASLLQHPNFQIHHTDGWKGWAEAGPYDAIHVGAAAQEIPKALVEQLAPGGMMVLPVGPAGGSQEMVEVTKDKEGNTKVRSLFGVMYVPLVKDPAGVSAGGGQLN